MSELGGKLIEPVTELLDEVGISYPDFDFEFGGRGASFYDPQKQSDSWSPRHEDYGPQAMIPPEDAKIVISAMHGYYFDMVERGWKLQRPTRSNRSDEHTSELQSLLRISYAVFCLKIKQQLS